MPDNCGERLEPVAVILADEKLVRLLDHLGLPTDFPKTAPARSPPCLPEVDSQVDPREDSYLGMDAIPDAAAA